MRLLIAGGGTGGHVSPGLAVAAVWEARHGKGSVIWAGRPDSIEARMAGAADILFAGVEARPLIRRMDLNNLLLPWSLFKGFRQAWELLKREAPSVCLLTGGYVSVPLAFAALIRRIPLVLLEPNAVLGLANQFFSGAAEAVCVAYTMKKAPRHAVLTGNPVRFKAKLPAKSAALKKYDLNGAKPVLLVLPGSGAAHSVNVALAESLKRLKDAQLLWMCGEKDHAEMMEKVKAAKSDARVFAFLDDVASAYAAADLVLARCGASMLAEIAVAGKASLLVPYPHATGDHQRLNAIHFVEQGAARMILDHELNSERMVDEISGLLFDADRLKRMGQAAQRLAKLDAAENVAGVLHRVAKGFIYV